jgi:hypothetical protein
LPLPELKLWPPLFPDLEPWLVLVPWLPLLLPEVELCVGAALGVWLLPELKL